ncbi:hypothetical protein [Phosphitispora fastidiosa]|uniref:hypothetical protein n=1 Tax=Phosphitispora fastidiosa TaxID=2837202 RepID=UPI001E478C7F|nr:hypothetical protein [Phosphitispora fastidiosa]MBU7006869.1 tetratricopeptide (TPR) repeat protein [Phosphitispora fastidiosa]
MSELEYLIDRLIKLARKNASDTGLSAVESGLPVFTERTVTYLLREAFRKGDLGKSFRIARAQKNLRLMARVGRIWLKMGQRDFGLKAAVESGDDLLLRDIISEQCKTGDVFGALSLAGSIKDRRIRNYACGQIAQKYLDLGLIKDAINLIQGIENPADRFDAEKEMAGWLFDAGYSVAALRMASGIENEGCRVMAMGGIQAKVQAKIQATVRATGQKCLGYCRKTLKILDTVNQSGYKGPCIRETALSLLLMGYPGKGLALINRIEDPFEKTYALAEASIKLLQMGFDRTGALRALKWCQDCMDKMQGLNYNVYITVEEPARYFSMSDDEHARVISHEHHFMLDLFADGEKMIATLLKLSFMLHELGYTGTAYQVLQKAVQVNENSRTYLEDHSGNKIHDCDNLDRLISEMLRQGYGEEAFKLAAELDTVRLVKTSSILYQTGYADFAADLLTACVRDDNEPGDMLKLSHELYNQGQPNAAVKCLDRCLDKCINEYIKSSGNSGGLEELYETMLEISWEYSRQGNRGKALELLDKCVKFGVSGDNAKAGTYWAMCGCRDFRLRVFHECLKREYYDGAFKILRHCIEGLSGSREYTQNSEHITELSLLLEKSCNETEAGIASNKAGLDMVLEVLELLEETAVPPETKQSVYIDFIGRIHLYKKRLPEIAVRLAPMVSKHRETVLLLLYACAVYVRFYSGYGPSEVNRILTKVSKVIDVHEMFV